MRTGDVQITNMRTNESVLAGKANKGSPPLKGFATRRTQQPVCGFAGADGGSVDEQCSYGVRHFSCW